MKIKRTERGWPGHFIGAHNCVFRRNTLLEYKDIKIVISTVGNYNSEIAEREKDDFYRRVGADRYYETMAFHSKKDDERYHDMDVNRQVYFDSNWAIDKLEDDDKANNMHEKVVEEISKKLLAGKKLKEESYES